MYSAKHCLHCDEFFAKNAKLSLKQWEEQRFCSVECSARHRAGSPYERFGSCVEASGDCLFWTGYQQRGYGSIWTGEKRVQVHRWAWEQEVGPIPDGMTLHHRCRQKLCVNVAHLKLMTRSDHQTLHAPKGFPAAAVAAAAQINLRKTHCPQGHPYDDENTGRSSAGGRYCKACRRASTKRRYWSRKAAA